MSNNKYSLKTTSSNINLNNTDRKTLAIILFVILVFILSACDTGTSSSSGSSNNKSWSCTEFDAPYDVVFIDGEAEVFSGVDEPSLSVKGHITGGAAGIEARCSGSSGSFYRLKGVDWWGWVRTSDTYK